VAKRSGGTREETKQNTWLRTVRGKMCTMRSWPQLRAALVTFHVVALVLVNVPAPTGSPLALTGHDASAGEELATWARVLHVPPAELARELLTIRAAWLSSRARILGPFDAYQRLVGAQQPWQMFSAPNRAPARLVIEVMSAGGLAWSFVGGLPLGDWRPLLFNSERLRSFTNATAREADHAQLDALCDALGRLALADHAGATQARCRVLLQRSPALGQRGPVDDKTLHERVVSRVR
jgi:hypothetical protein